MEDIKKEGRYTRIHKQLEALLPKTEDPLARMATICAVLHHKMDHFFWTGFYMLKSGKLVVGPYQGPVACQELENEKGVCWAALNAAAPVVVPDVHAFPGHIACDSRSKSEITLPVFNQKGEIVAIFDVDSDHPDSFSEVDKLSLTGMMEMIYKEF
ncbi:MAG: GAF domain-containing protein [Bacteroidales bacterium]|nr:GAF domain-containing protein [Bacteroidales bacterium]